MQGPSNMRNILRDDMDDDGLPAFGNPNELRNPKSHYFPSKPRPRREPPSLSHLVNPAPLASIDSKGKEKQVFAERAQHAQPRRRSESESLEHPDDDELDDGQSDDGDRRRSDENSHAAGSIEDGGKGDDTGSKKRSRTLTTAHQTAVLNALLAKTRFPSTETREEVGAQIGMSARRVQIWFQNRRQSQKRQREKEAADHATSVAAAAAAHHQAQQAHMHYAQMNAGRPQPYGARPWAYDARPSFPSRLSYESSHPSLQERQPGANYSSRALPEFDAQGRPISFGSVSSASSRHYPTSGTASAAGTARPPSTSSHMSRLSGFAKLQIDSPKMNSGPAFIPNAPMSPTSERPAPDLLDYAMATLSRPTRVAPARSLLPGPPMLPFPTGQAPRPSEADAALQAPILPSISSSTFPTRAGPRLPPLRDMFPRASTYSSTSTGANASEARKASVESDWSGQISSSAATSVFDQPVPAPVGSGMSLPAPAPVKQAPGTAPPVIPPISAMVSGGGVDMDLDKATAAEWKEASSRLKQPTFAATPFASMAGGAKTDYDSDDAMETD